MNDLISRQAAIEKIHSDFDECLVWDESGKHTADEVERILDTIPPADVRPVKRGRWVYGIVRADIPIPLECSACEWQVTRRTNFCPNCGADMRGGDADSDEKD